MMKKREILEDKKPEKSLFGQLLDASSVGIQLVLCTFAGFLIGYFLDRWLGTSPYLKLIFLVIGIIAGFKELFRISKREEDKGAEVENDRNNKPGL